MRSVWLYVLRPDSNKVGLHLLSYTTKPCTPQTMSAMDVHSKFDLDSSDQR
jgi:hypothetical protein